MFEILRVDCLKKKGALSVDRDESAHYKPPHLGLKSSQIQPCSFLVL